MNTTTSTSSATTTLHICPPDHKHAAKSTCYTAHRCRCPECIAGNTRRANFARRQIAYGRYTDGQTDPAPVVEHIRELQAFGYSYEAIAAAADVSAQTVLRVNTRQLKFVQGRVAHAILSVEPTLDDLIPTALIPAAGVSRRIQALCARGWSITAIADQLGCDRRHVSGWLRQAQVRVSTHQAVAVLYERLWNAPPPTGTPQDVRAVRIAMHRAQAAGWVPPLAWDDIDTDPAPYVPEGGDGPVLDMVAIELAVEGHPVALTQEERLLAVTHLNGRGISDNAIAHMLQVTGRTILRDRTALGLPAAVGPDGQPLDHDRDDSQGVAA